MSLFGPNRPKGITKEELYFIRGELRAGSGSEKLTERQTEYILELLGMALDSDSTEDIKYHWEQVSQDEEKRIEIEIADNKTMTFSASQRARVHKVLQKYIDINRVKSLL
jgi:hypothetical protein